MGAWAAVALAGEKLLRDRDSHPPEVPSTLFEDFEPEVIPEVEPEVIFRVNLSSPRLNGELEETTPTHEESPPPSPIPGLLFIYKYFPKKSGKLTKL